ncbi:MAG: hypothetical protein UW07_C0048G0004 [Candidatus Nomurabacteria bacterium GW2011_GWF2_43_8]|uniref:Uncharacterized protein n=1 Tax=Candidatus Nomurabacteria bacterium GW2011_GWF2_43_8 TaxID=1618779 RepID=A0A0G1HQX1_9BACT|nr:MAG: hypothetical protein UW07_C0048G0004 [Candidatus Nomurabacteria bacterium GW2011_GWF2_43_8]
MENKDIIRSSDPSPLPIIQPKFGFFKKVTFSIFLYLSIVVLLYTLVYLFLFFESLDTEGLHLDLLSTAFGAFMLVSSNWIIWLGNHPFSFRDTTYWNYSNIFCNFLFG